MTTKEQMQGALASLSQTLTMRADDAALDQQVFLQWYGAKQACNATLGRANDWIALPDQDEAYTGPTAEASAATNRVAIVSAVAAWPAALSDAFTAVQDIAHLLGP